jgi:hypothetical protein
VKILFVVKRIATDVLLFFTEFCLYNKQKNTWVLGNTSTRNKYGISAQPCIILYILSTYQIIDRMHKYSESQIATDYSPIVQVKTMRENNDCIYILCNPKLSINNVMLFPHGHRQFLGNFIQFSFFRGEAK